MKLKLIFSALLVLLMAIGAADRAVAQSHNDAGWTGYRDYRSGYHRTFRGWHSYNTAKYWRRGPGDHGMPSRMTREWYPARHHNYSGRREFFHGARVPF